MEPWTELERARLVQVARSSFSSRILPLDDDQMHTAGKMAAEVLDSPGWALVEELLAWRRGFLLEALIHGSILGKAEYAAQTGMVSGIDQARFVLHALVDFAHEREEQLAEQQALAAEEEASGV